MALGKEAVVRVKYHNPNMIPVGVIECGDWVDLRAAETVNMKAGEFKIISLGMSVKIPQGYELWIAPRSSTFKNFGILQTNSPGIVDESYCGDDDVLGFPALAMRDTTICVNDRICQCRLVKHQPDVCFVKVDHLGGRSRGGFGSTGTK